MPLSLVELEAQAQRYLENVADNWFSFAKTLLEIRTSGAYRETGLTWDGYIHSSRFSVGYGRIRQLLASVSLAEQIQTMSGVMLPERTLRDLKHDHNEADIPQAVAIAQSAMALVSADHAPLQKRHIVSALQVLEEARATGAVSVAGESVRLTQTSPLVVATAEAMREANIRHSERRLGNRKRVRGIVTSVTGSSVTVRLEASVPMAGEVWITYEEVSHANR
jgi:hypothetical protein